ncbi:MAG: GreA/GreB family elongation factor [Taibaiella sp.]|nr:GreA/GreB family elongation factor [Taibaiella sp.]
MSELKEKLYILCHDYIANRVAVIKQNVAEAQEAAGEDTKSSAGDKFEVGREMMQQEIELNLARLGEMYKLQITLENVHPSTKNAIVSPGALIYTTSGVYYMSIAAGKLQLDGTTYYAISPEAPIATQMMGKKAGDEFELNGNKITIEKVY